MKRTDNSTTVQLSTALQTFTEVTQQRQKMSMFKDAATLVSMCIRKNTPITSSYDENKQIQFVNNTPLSKPHIMKALRLKPNDRIESSALPELSSRLDKERRVLNVAYFDVLYLHGQPLTPHFINCEENILYVSPNNMTAHLIPSALIEHRRRVLGVVGRCLVLVSNAREDIEIIDLLTHKRTHLIDFYELNVPLLQYALHKLSYNEVSLKESDDSKSILWYDLQLHLL